MAAYIRKASQFRIVQPTLLCQTNRKDSPYLTQSGVFGSFTYTDQTDPLFPDIGKFPGVGGLLRLRIGAAFEKARFYPGTTRFQIVFAGYDWKNTLEAWTPRIYVSNTDDFALYTTTAAKAAWDWEANLNNDLGAMQYNVLTQRVEIPFALVAAAGTHLCVVMGENLELTNGGSDAVLGNESTCHPQIYLEAM